MGGIGNFYLDWVSQGGEKKGGLFQRGKKKAKEALVWKGLGWPKVLICGFGRTTLSNKRGIRTSKGISWMVTKADRAIER